jgi:hypothetical protein
MYWIVPLQAGLRILRWAPIQNLYTTVEPSVNFDHTDTLDRYELVHTAAGPDVLLTDISSSYPIFYPVWDSVMVS